MVALRPPGLALSRSAPLRTKLPVKDDPVKCPFLSTRAGWYIDELVSYYISLHRFPISSDQHKATTSMFTCYLHLSLLIIQPQVSKSIRNY